MPIFKLPILTDDNSRKVGAGDWSNHNLQVKSLKNLLKQVSLSETMQT